MQSIERITSIIQKHAILYPNTLDNLFLYFIIIFLEDVSKDLLVEVYSDEESIAIDAFYNVFTDVVLQNIIKEVYDTEYVDLNALNELFLLELDLQGMLEDEPKGLFKKKLVLNQKGVNFLCNIANKGNNRVSSNRNTSSTHKSSGLNLGSRNIGTNIKR